MNTNIFIVNYTKLARWQVAHALRQAEMMVMENSLVSGISTLYQLFLRYRDAKLYQLSITPQVCYLEKMLNDRFDFTERRIYIEDGLSYDPTYLYMEAEEKPMPLYMESEDLPVVLYTEGETGLDGDDFIVYVPTGLSYNENEMKALLNVYKLAGKRYKIQVQ